MKRCLLHITAVLIVTLPMVPAFAMPSPGTFSVKPSSMSTPFSAGAAHGGQAGRDFSLLDVREVATQGSEKLLFVYGDSQGRKIHGSTGFYHVAVDRGGHRVVIDLAQVSKTAIDPIGLQLALGSSKLVASSEMTMDPHDGSTDIVLNLARKVALRVGQDEAANGSLVLEMMPISEKHE